MKTIVLTCLVAVIAVGHLSQCASVSKTASKSSDEVRSDFIKQLTELLDVRRSESSKKTIDSANAPKEAHKARLESLRTPVQVESKRANSCDSAKIFDRGSVGYIMYPKNLKINTGIYDYDDDGYGGPYARDGNDRHIAQVIREEHSVGHARSETRTAHRDDDGTCRYVIRGSNPNYPQLSGEVAVLNDDGSTDCSKGHLKMYDGDDESGDPFIELCGRTKRQTFQSSGKDIYVDFSNGGGADNAGFYIFWYPYEDY